MKIRYAVPPAILRLPYIDTLRMALMDSQKDGLQETTNVLCIYAVQAGLRINVRKAEFMAIAKNTSQRQCTKEGTVEGSLA